LGVSATFKVCELYTPNNVTINSPDSFRVIPEQRTLHKFEPNRIWQSIATTQSFINGYSSFGNYPMSWWNITLNKTKGGIQSFVKDRIFADIGSSSTYTIPW
jgi:hypothetical protein